MKCSKCGNEMQTGFVRPTGRGGICWVDNETKWQAPVNDAGYFQIGSSPYLKSECIPANHCPSCKVILIDYSRFK